MAVNRSLAVTHPELIEEWHPQLNHLSPSDFTSGSGKSAFWKCRKSELHVWSARIQHRADAGSGCPYCSGKKVCADNNLAYADQNLAKEVHPSSRYSAQEVTAGSSQEVTWQCHKVQSHVWDDSVKHRRSGRGCPFCANKRVSEANSLAALFPELATEFDVTRNGKTTDQVIAGENQEYWWTCSQGPDHQWSARMSSRTYQRNGCPFCAGQRASITNSLENFPSIASELHPHKNSALTAADLAAGTTRRVWWLCSRDACHEWQATVVSRTRGTGCPKCFPLFQSRTEIELAAELGLHFDVNLDDHEIITASKAASVDIVIYMHNIVIEYDGHHWHKDRIQEDLAKTKRVQEAGWAVLRIRESPLSKILETDCVVDKIPIKLLADTVLRHLRSVFGIQSSHLSDYLAKTTPQATHIAQAHLDKINKADQDRFALGVTELRTFRSQYNRSPVPPDYRTESCFELGKWCARMRLRHSRGELSARQEADLNDAGLSFDPFKDAWERHFSALLDFISKRNHAEVGHGNKYIFHGEEIGLGSWISNQKSKRQNGVGSSRGELRPDRFARLDALPQWRWREQ